MADRMIQCPTFGDQVEGIHAAAENPQKFGTFVEAIRRTGRFNKGVFYRVTDECGAFWEYPAESCIVHRRKPTANDRAVERIEGFCQDRVESGFRHGVVEGRYILDIIREEADRG